MEEAIIPELPDEIFEHIFSYVRIQDFFGLFITCKKIHTLTRKFELWRFWIKRDLLENYETYLDKINAKNEVITDAIEIRPQIDPLFILINKALAELKVHTDKLTEILNDIPDQESYDIYLPESRESIDADFEYLQDNLTNYCNDTSGNELTLNMFETDPIALYIQLATEHDIIPCTNMIKRPGRKINSPCREPSVPRKKYCQTCLSATKNLIMMPKIPSFPNLPGFPFGMSSAQPKPEIFPIPQLPVYIPPRLKVKNFSPGKFATTNTEPSFVIEYINGGYCLVGVNDTGTEIRTATYPEKEIAHGLGISISF